MNVNFLLAIFVVFLLVMLLIIKNSITVETMTVDQLREELGDDFRGDKE